MFEPGHVHRDNSQPNSRLKKLPPFSLDIYYQVERDPVEGPILRMRVVGHVADNPPFEESFTLRRDLAYNFASAASRIVEEHGLPIIASPIMRGHEEYDKVFNDIREKLDRKSGEPVDLDRFLSDPLPHIEPKS